MKLPLLISFTTLLTASLFLAASTARADVPQLAAADDDDRPAGMDEQDWADLQDSATLDREDLYEDEAVTKVEFAAQVAALDVEMAETIRAKAAIVYDGEE